MKTKKIEVGLLGLGRLGRLYARNLAGRILETTLTAVADTDGARLEAVGEECGVSRRYLDGHDLLDDCEVEAVVIATPTHTHKGLIEAAAQRGKPIFCEKPVSLSLEEATAIKKVVQESGVFFQMGFMRRFDPGYAAAKAKLDAGVIGSPVLFKSTSRDPYRPDLEYLRPASSGGIFVDMGIHDFDLALWLVGRIQSVHSIGGVIVYPEIRPLGDLDNAIVTVRFLEGQLGVIDLSRSGVYAYDISTEVLGTRGALRTGYLQETPLMVLTGNQVAHDTVPYFMERFDRAYQAQLTNFARNLLTQTPPPITVDDGIEALRTAVAAARSYETGQSVEVDSIR
ncbi:MAG: Gfo/Idh/MocA family oxidoreductase [Acidobacteriota bacterium]